MNEDTQRIGEGIREYLQELDNLEFTVDQKIKALEIVLRDFKIAKKLRSLDHGLP